MEHKFSLFLGSASPLCCYDAPDEVHRSCPHLTLLVKLAMILEVAILDVIPGQESDFEQAFFKAQKIISAMPGYMSHELKRCIQKRSRYILLVNWKKLGDHTDGFRASAEYQEWKALLHHFYDPFPEVEHYENAFT